jgi:hypothetical protein
MRRLVFVLVSVSLVILLLVVINQAEYRTDKELLAAGIHYIPPSGWQKIKLPDMPDAVSYSSPYKQASIIINFGMPGMTIDVFEEALDIFRKNMNIISEEEISFLNVPCHVFTTQQPDERGFWAKTITYQFFKNGKIFNIVYTGWIENSSFDKYLNDFQKSLNSYYFLENK